VVSTHQWDWDERLPIFLLACRASTHETTGVTPSSMVFGQELHLPCDLKFGGPPDKEQSMQTIKLTLLNDYMISTTLPAST
jgi:hypothetical protein